MRLFVGNIQWNIQEWKGHGVSNLLFNGLEKKCREKTNGAGCEQMVNPSEGYMGIPCLILATFL